MGHAKDTLDELRTPARELRHETPEVWKGFAQLHGAAMAEGELSAGTKELIALAIAIVKKCDGCIASHAKAAAAKGVTKAQVAEMVGVTMLMEGGPATVYGPRAWDAFLEFAEPDDADS